jgi:hypothetical protein
MSGTEYYHIKGYIAPEEEKTGASTKMEALLDLPTAPMYRDLDTYNGKCAIWLKHICLANADGAEGAIIRTFFSQVCPVLVMKGCPSLNQLGLVVNRGLNWNTAPPSSPFLLSAGSSRLEGRGGFRDASFYCPFNSAHLDIAGAVAGGGAFVGDQLALVGNGTGAGGSDNYPATRLLLDNAKYFTEYSNPSVGNMADAVIVNNIWGKRQLFAFEGFKKGVFNAAQVESFANYFGDISFELVIQPLKNEPIYRGLPDDDKQRRL